MKAGLFLCDHVNPESQPRFGDYPEKFARLFPEFDFVFYDAINGHFPSQLDECDLYMATGSRHSVYEDLAWIKRLKEIIRELYCLDKYFIGFCFGHQLIGEALGGRVAKSPLGWCIGVHEFAVPEQAPWMQPLAESFNLLMMCQDQVLDLPEHAIVLAGNEKCPVGMFQVGEKVLGIQAHPEFSKDYDRLLMENRIDRMGEELVQEGLRSLAKEVHTDLIRSWVLQFVGYK
jgi:GMP synthase-like glutamine amidotransferase